MAIGFEKSAADVHFSALNSIAADDPAVRVLKALGTFDTGHAELMKGRVGGAG